MSRIGILEELQSEVDCWMDGWPERGSEERTADRLIDVCLRFPRPDPLPSFFHLYFPPIRMHAVLSAQPLYLLPASTGLPPNLLPLFEPIHP